MSNPSGSGSRINMRIDADQKTLIERGAAARGLNVTDFLLTAGLREAEKALIDRTVFTLDKDAYAHFCAILERPDQDNPTLRARLGRNKTSKWKIVP